MPTGKLPDSASLVLGSCQYEEPSALAGASGLGSNQELHLQFKGRPQTKDPLHRGLWISSVSLEVPVLQASAQDHEINLASLRYRAGDAERTELCETRVDLLCLCAVCLASVYRDLSMSVLWYVVYMFMAGRVCLGVLVLLVGLRQNRKGD